MKRSVVNAAICSALFLSATQVHAAGFQLAEYSSTGLGRAFAGEAAIADNASAQGRNPALLTELKGRNLSTGAIYVKTNVDVPGEVSVAGTPIKLDASGYDVAANAVVPNFYYSSQVSDQITWGVAFNSNYGLATEVDSQHAAAIFGQKTSITTVELNPNVAYKLNEQFSFGLGLRAVYAEGELNSTVPAWTTPLGLPLPPAGTSLKGLEGDDIAFGWKAGMSWAPSTAHKFGLAYHSGVKLTIDGEATGFSYKDRQGTQSFIGELPVELPAFAEFSSFHQVTDKLALHTSINWTQWSVFEELRITFNGDKKPLVPKSGQPMSEEMSEELLKEENFKDSWRYAVGGTYQLTQVWALRAGVALDKTAAQDEYRTTTIPDSDRMWYSMGVGYQASDKMTVDFGVTYIKSHGDAPIDETIPGSGFNFKGNAEGDVWLAGVQLSYKM